MRASLAILATSLAASMLGLSTCAEAQNGAGENARAVEKGMYTSP